MCVCCGRYKDESRWRLVPAWPFLAAFSEAFRAELLRVLGLDGKKQAQQAQGGKDGGLTGGQQ